MLTTDEFFIWIKEVAIFPHASRMVSFVAAPGKKKEFWKSQEHENGLQQWNKVIWLLRDE